jgi:hypothetical protein
VLSQMSPMRRQKRAFLRKLVLIFRRIRQIAFFLIFVVLSLLAYLCFYGFPDSWKQTLLQQLAQRGVHLQIESLSLDPLDGVVAREIHFQPNPEKKTSVSVRELALNISFLDVLRRRFAFDHLEVDGSDIQLYSEAGGDPIVVQRAKGRFRFEKNSILHLEQVEGNVLGIALEVNGRLDLSKGPEGPKPAPSKLNANTIHQYLTRLGEVKMGKPIRVNLQVDGKLAEPQTIRAKAEIHGTSVSYEGWQADVVSGHMIYEKDILAVPEVTIEAGGGKFSLFGYWEIRTGNLQFEVVSNLDPRALFVSGSKTQPKWLEEMRFGMRPEIWAKGSIDLVASEPLKTLEADTSFWIREMMWRGRMVREAKGNPKMLQGMVHLPNLIFVQDFGRMSGNVDYEIASKTFIFDIKSSVDIADAMKLLYPSEKNWFRTVKFEKPPSLQLKGRWATKDPNGLQAQGSIDWEDWSSRDVRIKSTKSLLNIQGRKFQFKNLKLTRPEGEIAGEFWMDFQTQTTWLDAVTTIAFSDLARMIGPATEDLFSPYRFPVPPKIRLKGSINFDDDSQNDFTASVEAPQLELWKLRASNVVADVHNYRKTLEIARYASTFYGGRLEGDAVFDLTTPRQEWAFHCYVDQVDFDLFTHDLWDYSEVKGRLTGWAEMNGSMKTSQDLIGKGEVQIQEGVLWKIPLFGALSKFIPLLGEHKAKKGTGKFTVANEEAYIDDMKIDAGILSLTAKGTYKFDQSLDFMVQAHFLRKIGLGYPLSILTKPFEYHLGGKLNGDWQWKPKYIPKELLLQFGDGKTPPKEEAVEGEAVPSEGKSEETPPADSNGSQ